MPLFDTVISLIRGPSQSDFALKSILSVPVEATQIIHINRLPIARTPQRATPPASTPAPRTAPSPAAAAVTKVVAAISRSVPAIASVVRSLGHSPAGTSAAQVKEASKAHSAKAVHSVGNTSHSIGSTTSNVARSVGKTISSILRTAGNHGSLAIADLLRGRKLHIKSSSGSPSSRSLSDIIKSLSNSAGKLGRRIANRLSSKSSNWRQSLFRRTLFGKLALRGMDYAGGYDPAAKAQADEMAAKFTDYRDGDYVNNDYQRMREAEAQLAAIKDPKLRQQYAQELVEQLAKQGKFAATTALLNGINGRGNFDEDTASKWADLVGAAQANGKLPSSVMKTLMGSTADMDANMAIQNLLQYDNHLRQPGHGLSSDLHGQLAAAYVMNGPNTMTLTQPWLLPSSDKQAQQKFAETVFSMAHDDPKGQNLLSDQRAGSLILKSNAAIEDALANYTAAHAGDLATQLGTGPNLRSNVMTERLISNISQAATPEEMKNMLLATRDQVNTAYGNTTEDQIHQALVGSSALAHSIFAGKLHNDTTANQQVDFLKNMTSFGLGKLTDAVLPGVPGTGFVEDKAVDALFGPLHQNTTGPAQDAFRNYVLDAAVLHYSNEWAKQHRNDASVAQYFKPDGSVDTAKIITDYEHMYDKGAAPQDTALPPAVRDLMTQIWTDDNAVQNAANAQFTNG